MSSLGWAVGVLNADVTKFRESQVVGAIDEVSSWLCYGLRPLESKLLSACLPGLLRLSMCNDGVLALRACFAMACGSDQFEDTRAVLSSIKQSFMLNQALRGVELNYLDWRTPLSYMRRQAAKYSDCQVILVMCESGQLGGHIQKHALSLLEPA